MNPQSDSRAARIARDLGSMVVWCLPLVLPLVPAAISLLLAAPDSSDSDDISWAFLAIPVAAGLGAWARAAQSAAVEEAKPSAWLRTIGAATVGAVIAYLVWWQAVEETCHGRYECPF